MDVIGHSSKFREPFMSQSERLKYYWDSVCFTSYPTLYPHPTFLRFKENKTTKTRVYGNLNGIYFTVPDFTDEDLRNWPFGTFGRLLDQYYVPKSAEVLAAEADREEANNFLEEERRNVYKVIWRCRTCRNLVHCQCILERYDMNEFRRLLLEDGNRNPLGI